MARKLTKKKLFFHKVALYTGQSYLTKKKGKKIYKLRTLGEAIKKANKELKTSFITENKRRKK